jgi:hypothetical protein
MKNVSKLIYMNNCRVISNKSHTREEKNALAQILTKIEIYAISKYHHVFYISICPLMDLLSNKHQVVRLNTC